MVKFERYPHINDLLNHYAKTLDRGDISKLINTGISSKEEAELFSRFIWEMVSAINEDEESGIRVLGSTDNTEMFPDLNYEVTKLMRSSGFYSVWDAVSRIELE
ncbi:hypothetical protein TDB9533_04422 [Thalassocella blandensis]|nr:hypothetical protein TDB9533_04422 [Thalassocella blandensis]